VKESPFIFEIFSLTNGWRGEAYPFEKNKRPKGKQTEFLLPLRRPRIQAEAVNYSVMPRTWQSRLRFSWLEIDLPSIGEEPRFLRFEFTTDAPELPVILGHPLPTVEENPELEHFPALAVCLELVIPITDTLRWPAWIKKAAIYSGATGTNATLLEDAPPAVLFVNVFGMAPVAAGNHLRIDPDGLLLAGSREIPWRDQDGIQRGLFRYLRRKYEADIFRHELILEQSPHWMESLRIYQDQIIDACLNTPDEKGMPPENMKSVGLTPAPLPEEITWHWTIEQGWVFSPEKSLFELALRGIAGGTAIWKPNSITIENQGLQIKCRSLPIDQNNLQSMQYRYSNDTTQRESVWSGSFHVRLNHKDRDYIVQQMADGLEGEQQGWLLTETGPLSLPLQSVDEIDLSAKDNRNLQGLMTLGEVPWKTSPDDESVLSPDLSSGFAGNLLLLDFESASAIFTFAQDEEGNLRCTHILASLNNPIFRMEEYLPFYLHPEMKRYDVNFGPPRLPDIKQDTAEHEFSFIAISLIHAESTPPGPNEPHWLLQIKFQTGRRGAEYIEGNWLDTNLSVSMPEQFATRAIYWYRPKNLHWFPTYPLFGDPRQDESLQLCAERTLMPLRPVTNQPITLKTGSKRETPVLQSGQFVQPVLETVNGTDFLFSWLIPEIPGNEFRLKPHEVVTITAGRPSSGLIDWVCRYELPMMDEPFTLMVGDKPGDQKNQETDLQLPSNADDRRVANPDWWHKLHQSAQLSQSRDNLLFTSTIHFNDLEVLKETDLPVTINKPVAHTSFAGKADISLNPPQMSLSLNGSDGTAIPFIAAEQMLKGPSAKFSIIEQAGSPFPLLIPEVTDLTDLILEAGCFVPQLISKNVSGTQPVFMDQNGRLTQTLTSETTGRASIISDPDDPAIWRDCFQWSLPELDLSDTYHLLRCFFNGLPLYRENTLWVYDATGPTEIDPILRDFNWGTVGATNLWGFDFQIFQLDRLEVIPGANGEPEQPILIRFSGVLHYKAGENARIRMADPARQRVQATFAYSGERWQLKEFDGRFLWPLYQNTPDYAEATEKNISDPLPWLEGPVSLPSNSEHSLPVFGTEEEPVQLSFQFLDRIWRIPMVFSPGLEDIYGNAPVLKWIPIPDSATTNAVLRVKNGMINLTGNMDDLSSQILFETQLAHAGSPNDALLSMELLLTITRYQSSVNITGAKLLSMGGTNHLAEIVPHEDQAIRITDTGITLAINKPAAFRSTASFAPFELLPGWPIDDEAPLLSYITLGFEQPPAGQRVQSALIESFQLIMETRIKTPEPVSVLLSFARSTGRNPSLSVKLTGQIRAQNDISWQSKDGQSNYRHEVTFLLRQAELQGQRLISSPDSPAFFEPLYLPVAEDPTGLAGMSELPCIAAHALYRTNGETQEPLFSWTSPQRLRISSVQSFVEEILLRGDKLIKTPNYNSHGNTAFSFVPAIETESGFSGAIGERLAQILLTAGGNFMLLESTEAFWVQEANQAILLRPARELWKNQTQTLWGIFSAATDFCPADENQAGEWLRLPFPFLTDTGGVIQNTLVDDEELAALMQNPFPADTNDDPKENNDKDDDDDDHKDKDKHDRDEDEDEDDHKVKKEKKRKKDFTPLNIIFTRNRLDRFSLENSPSHPGYGAPIDQVILQPEAYEHILPYTLPVGGFEPGWLIFRKASSATPFAETGLAIEYLVSHNKPGKLLCALETIPASRESTTLSERITDEQGRPRPYLLTGTLVETGITTRTEAEDSRSDFQILLEIYLPPATFASQDTGPLLTSRKVFRLGIKPGETWRDILFGKTNQNPEQDEENPVREKIHQWTRTEIHRYAKHQVPLLRASLLTPVQGLENRIYFLASAVDFSTAPNAAKSRRDPLSAKILFRLDPRLEPRAEPPLPDPLINGIDYLGGRTYYEEEAFYTPPRPIADTVTPAGVVLEFSAHPEKIKWGEPLILRWQIATECRLFLSVKNGPAGDEVFGNETILYPERSAIYTLLALAENGDSIGRREIVVEVEVPASGSAAGLAYKLAGCAAGRDHASRAAWARKQGGFHRWVEATRDLIFNDLTRRDAVSRFEPGWFLPAARKIKWPSDEMRLQSEPFLPLEAIHIYTHGRPGSYMRLRSAFLREESDGMLNRSASSGFELRHPRPVPIPRELWAFNPFDSRDIAHRKQRATCFVQLLGEQTPFLGASLEWQDPLFNRRLLAAAKDVQVDDLKLTLDRSIYAGRDVFYPELRFKPATLNGTWIIELSLSISRKIRYRPQTIDQRIYRIYGRENGAVHQIHNGTPAIDTLPRIKENNPALSAKGVQRWIWELGLDQSEAKDDSFNLSLQNHDKIYATARLLTPTAEGREDERFRLKLDATIRTDLKVWPQPQSGFAVIRTEHGQEAIKSETAAFGWFPVPVVVKRRDRFLAESWEGTFRYRDVFIPEPGHFMQVLETVHADELQAELNQGILPQKITALFSGQNTPPVDLTTVVEAQTVIPGHLWFFRKAHYQLVIQAKLEEDQPAVFSISSIHYRIASFTAYGEQVMEW